MADVLRGSNYDASITGICFHNQANRLRYACIKAVPDKVYVSGRGKNCMRVERLARKAKTALPTPVGVDRSARAEIHFPFGQYCLGAAVGCWPDYLPTTVSRFRPRSARFPRVGNEADVAVDRGDFLKVLAPSLPPPTYCPAARKNFSPPTTANVTRFPAEYPCLGNVADVTKGQCFSPGHTRFTAIAEVRMWYAEHQMSCLFYVQETILSSRRGTLIHVSFGRRTFTTVQSALLSEDYFARRSEVGDILTGSHTCQQWREVNCCKVSWRQLCTIHLLLPSSHFRHSNLARQLTSRDACDGTLAVRFVIVRFTAASCRRAEFLREPLKVAVPVGIHEAPGESDGVLAAPPNLCGSADKPPAGGEIYAETFWPARSPDLTPLDYFLWGHMKDVIYETPVESEEDLLAQIMAAADLGLPGIGDRVYQNMREQRILEKTKVKERHIPQTPAARANTMTSFVSNVLEGSSPIRAYKSTYFQNGSMQWPVSRKSRYQSLALPIREQFVFTARGPRCVVARLLASHLGDPDPIFRRGRSRIFVRGNRDGGCRWSAGFLRDLPFTQLLYSGAVPYSPRFTHVGFQGLVVKEDQAPPSWIYGNVAVTCSADFVFRFGRRQCIGH
ncbi:hypothetical protein PR048_014632 [Dryococelus australis]|uniref:Uncharacterized protein n=1 Tax=Dryococelus australis TaxID=614101 RepID=A0ABQ9HFK1_9NEOP|nr:hypothetical protein PR048_014632 [Dryococelus australis]